jgi:hypothetical protein
VDEAATLTGLAVTNLEQMRVAAERLHEMGATAVVITGGHLDKAIDLLSFTSRHGTEQEVFKSNRLESRSTHGTGCAFSTAMACHLARGRGLPEAVLLSKTYVAAAIANAHPLGRGTGPIHHLYRMHQQRRVVINDPTLGRVSSPARPGEARLVLAEVRKIERAWYVVRTLLSGALEVDFDFAHIPTRTRTSGPTWAAQSLALLLGGLLEQQAGGEGCDGSQQPLHAVELYGLKIVEGLNTVDQANRDPGHNQAHHSDQKSDQ